MPGTRRAARRQRRVGTIISRANAWHAVCYSKLLASARPGWPGTKRASERVRSGCAPRAHSSPLAPAGDVSPASSAGAPGRQLLKSLARRPISLVRGGDDGGTTMAQTLNEMVDAMESEMDAATEQLGEILNALESYPGEFADRAEERAFERQHAAIEREIERTVDAIERRWHRAMDRAGY